MGRVPGMRYPERGTEEMRWPGDEHVTSAAERWLTLTRSLDLKSTLSVIRRGSGDPTWVDERGRATPGSATTTGAVAKAWNTPDGPVSVVLRVVPGGAQLHASAWGPGGGWLLDRLPALIGQTDDDTGFESHHDRVARLRRDFPGWRLPATGLVLESLVPSVLEQRVTGAEAFGAYRRLVRAYGSPAPGPLADRGLMVAPTPAAWAAIPSWVWLQAGVDAARSATVRRVCVSPGRLEDLVDHPADASRRLGAIAGVGAWTVAEVAHTALGDADAVSFGDYHVAKNVGWALLGRPIDDTELAVVLQPYAGHRYRVQRLVELSGLQPPRRGPRRAMPAHLPGARRAGPRRSR